MRWTTGFVACLSICHIACKAGPERQPEPQPEPQLEPQAEVRSEFVNPAKLCEHVLAMSSVRISDRAQVDCVDALLTDSTSGSTSGECLLAARSLAQVQACKVPLGNFALEFVDPLGPYAMCRHIFDVMKRDLGEANTFDEQKEHGVVTGCVWQTMKDRQRVGGPAHREMVNCVVKASTSEQLQACYGPYSPTSTSPR
jgi:hypothetical protein